jgi:hypothetical protein
MCRCSVHEACRTTDPRLDHCPARGACCRQPKVGEFLTTAFSNVTADAPSTLPARNVHLSPASQVSGLNIGLEIDRPIADARAP